MNTPAGRLAPPHLPTFAYAVLVAVLLLVGYHLVHRRG